MIFGFYYFSDDPPLDNDGDEKDKQDEYYTLDEDDHDDESSDPQCSISRSSGAITSPRTWPPKQTYTRSKSLESVLIQMHKKFKDLLVFKS